MKEKIRNVLDNFLGKEVKELKAEKKSKKITTKSGEIIEHVEKKLIVEDGRELLL